MLSENEKMLADAMRNAREKTPPRVQREGATRKTRKMTGEEAAELIKQELASLGYGVRRLGGSMLLKMEAGLHSIPKEIAIAAESVYGLAADTLTKFYDSGKINLSDQDRSSGEQSNPFAIVPIGYYRGGSTRTWSLKRDEMGSTQGYAFLKGKRCLEVGDAGLGTLPAKSLIAFEPDDFPHEGIWLWCERKGNPNDAVVRYISPADPTHLLGEPDDEPLELAQWNIRGWAFAWAAMRGRDWPDWKVVRGGIGPNTPRV